MPFKWQTNKDNYVNVWLVKIDLILYPTVVEEITMFEKLKEIIVDELSINPDDVTLDAELSNDLGINSLELADLVLLCEDTFGVEFKEEDIHKFITVGDVVEYLNENAQ
jgi:acyl carrier protein